LPRDRHGLEVGVDFLADGQALHEHRAQPFEQLA